MWQEKSFNPCFNGSMYKNFFRVPTIFLSAPCFNPCFNGSMYKNWLLFHLFQFIVLVSILVLMDLCIKTKMNEYEKLQKEMFQSLF